MYAVEVRQRIATSGRASNVNSVRARVSQKPVNPLWQRLATRPIGGSAERLPTTVQGKMERAFGVDFSAVRIHQDDRAQGVGARAFAQGTNLHFAPGEYSPHTKRGQTVLGHELAHVSQQAAGRVRVPAQALGGPIHDDPELEREADEMGERASRGESVGDGAVGASGSGERLEGRLPHLMGGESEEQPIQRKVEMPSNSNLPDFHEDLTKNGDIYSFHQPLRKAGLRVEVFTSLFHSPRIFKLQGDNGKRAQYFLMRHLAARRRVVAFARKKKYVFEAGRQDFRMNPKYWAWDIGTGKFWKKEEADSQEARDDVNKNPGEYRIGCAAAAKITMEGGGQSKRALGTTAEDKDWIPGDGGFIKNDGWNGTAAGLEGENIIYMGGKQFWGHYLNTNTMQPYPKWFELVNSWNRSAKLTPDREWPSKGLK